MKTDKKSKMAKARAKKKPVKENTTTRVHVVYSQRSYGGEPESDDRWSSRTDEHHETSFKHILIGDTHTSSYPYDYESIEVDRKLLLKDPEVLHVLVVYYSDGDTFGHSSGNIHVHAAYETYDKAWKAGQALEKNDKSEKHKDMFLPWNSYFAGFESFDVHTLRVVREVT